ncbi:hypothetical protein BJV78DRAFT_1129780, partial [Lactifluus subvellereus]
SDLYISLYTPTLSALIESLDTPSLPLVAQAGASLPGVWEKVRVMQALNMHVTGLIWGWVTPASVIDGLQGHRFARFACHGTLEAGKPFDA